MNKEHIIEFFKNKNNKLILIILIIGVIIMLFPSLLSSSPKSEKCKSAFNEEERLCRILSDIDGAGKVSVMITYYGTTEKDIAYEVKTASSDGLKSSEDKKAVMSGSEPMVVRETYPEVKGVIVTAQGAESAAVKRKLTEAVTAALDIPEYRVCICRNKE